MPQCMKMLQAAGLHFDEELLDSIKKLGVKFATINLSVGAGTFH